MFQLTISIYFLELQRYQKKDVWPRDLAPYGGETEVSEVSEGSQVSEASQVSDPVTKPPRNPQRNKTKRLYIPIDLKPFPHNVANKTRKNRKTLGQIVRENDNEN